MDITDEEIIKRLTDALDKYEREQALQKLNEAFKVALAEQGIPLKHCRGITIKNQEEMLPMIEKVKAIYKAEKKSKKH